MVAWNKERRIKDLARVRAVGIPVDHLEGCRRSLHWWEVRVLRSAKQVHTRELKLKLWEEIGRERGKGSDGGNGMGKMRSKGEDGWDH